MSKSNSNQLKPDTYTYLRGCSPGLCRFIGTTIAASHNDRILDIGCGPGENTALLSGLTGCVVEGLDIDQERIDYAKASNPALNFHRANAEDLPFSDTSFGAATMMLSVHRFLNRNAVLREVSRVLISGGRICIATVSPEQLHARPDFRAFPSALRLECERFPTVKALRNELSDHGFVEIKDQVYREVIRPLDTGFLRWLQSYPFTVLLRISEEEFQNGLRRIQESIRSAGNVQLLCDEYTIINAIKP